MPTPKELKKLADMCRKVGIKSYKGADFEFTLTDDAPQKPGRKGQAINGAAPDKDFKTDSLSDEQILMWSASDGGLPYQLDSNKEE